MRKLLACVLSALVISGCDRPADLVGPEDPLEARTASADRIVDLGTLGGSWAVAMDINNRGEVVGYSGTASGGVIAFIWTPQAGMRPLAGLDQPSTAVAINNVGQVVGRMGESPYLWSEETGVQQILDIPDSWCGSDPSCYAFRPIDASDINDHGQVVLLNYVHAFVWSSATGPRQIRNCGSEPWAFGINNLGQVVGESDYTRLGRWEPTGPWDHGIDGRLGFLWDPDTGGCRLIENAAWLATNAVAINDDGMIAGEGGATASPISPRRLLAGLPAPLRVASAGGFGFLALGTFGGHDTGGYAGTGEAVNDRGDVAGYSFTSAGARHAFVWTHNRGMKDLGTLGGEESAAMGINAKGDVAGWSLDAAGNRRAVLWTKRGGSIPKSSGVASHASFSLAPAPAKSFEVASCPGRPGMLLEIGALDRCPVRDGQVRQ